jgi:hypothetical protein
MTDPPFIQPCGVSILPFSICVSILFSVFVIIALSLSGDANIPIFIHYDPSEIASLRALAKV